MLRPVRPLRLTSRSLSVRLRTSTPRTLLLAMSPLSICSAAYDDPPSAMNTATVAITLA